MEDSDKKLLAGMLTKCAHFFLERGREEALKLELEARLAARDLELANYRATFKLFGFDGFTPEMWKGVSDALGQPVYQAALDEGKALFDKAHAAPGTLIQIANQQETKNETPTIQAASSDRPKIREIVLTLLKDAGEKGEGATVLRKYIEAVYSITLHEKTVGMTLYRLSKDGLARRDGRTWYFVPQPAATKSPGGDAPGPNVLD